MLNGVMLTFQLDRAEQQTTGIRNFYIFAYKVIKFKIKVEIFELYFWTYKLFCGWHFKT
jgi:hypothetical protein